MGISTAMQTGVAGLSANSAKVGKISENIANANTVGYKRNFADLVTTQAGGGNSAAGVRAVDRMEVSRGGTPITTNSLTDLSIAGDGFFIVSKNPNDPVEANYFLSRAGSFTPDENGNLKNSAGYFLAGYPYQPDGNIGAIDRNGFGDLNTVALGDIELQAEPTTRMAVTGNLPEQETGVAAPGAPFISSKSIFNPLGGIERMQLSWQPTATANQWTLTVSDGAGVDYGSVDVEFADSGPNAGAPSAFTNDTNLATAPADFSFVAATGTATLTLDNGTFGQQVFDMTLGAPGTFDGVTQFNGDFTPQKFDIDGSGVAGIARTEIDDNGDVIGVFDNGVRRSLFQIPVGRVINPDGLIAEDGNVYRLSREAGEFQIFDAGVGDTGTVQANSLEGSNVDIATELTDLIATQRAYSSNAKIVTTADEMLAETMQIKR